MPENPEVYFGEDRYRLSSLRMREEPVSIHAEVDDVRTKASKWLVTAVLYRLVVMQEIKQEFTAPSSFPLPPTIPLPGTSAADATDISKVDLETLLGGRYTDYLNAGMEPWRIAGQTLTSTDGVYYTLVTRLITRSNIVWDVDAFRRYKLPDPA